MRLARPPCSFALAALAMTVAVACSRPPEEPVRAPMAIAYPATRSVDHQDPYFGERVADPYRWMEELAAPELAAWVRAQNAVAEPALAAIPARARILRRLTALWQHERFGVPVAEGGRYFITRNDGLQAQDVLYVFDAWGAAPRVLIDPNGFSTDGTVALGGFVPSPDGARVAYSVQDGGSDWRTWRVRDVDSGRDLADELAYTKFTGVSWSRDGAGFYYSRYPVGPGPDYRGDDQQPVAIWYHRVGKPQSDDRRVLDLGHPTRTPYGTVSEDGAYLVVSVFDGYDRSALQVMRLDRLSPKPEPLADRWDALYSYLGNQGPIFFVHTTEGAPNGRVVAIDLRDPAPARWREVVPETKDALESASYVGGRIVAQYLRDARARVVVHGGDGALQREVELPGLGSVSGFAGHADRDETFFAFQGFTQPPTILRYDVATGSSEVFRRAAVAAELDRFVTEQVFATSKDGTRVPLFIVHRRDLARDGRNPTLLYGYGGFAVSETPAFSVARAVWLEMGGVLAIANLRGGGEYGEAWHQAGTKLRKQNVFDDFIAAAEHLVAAGYTSADRLAIQGGSNGGLLVGAVLNQRPELFGAALPAVGVMDMLRYQTASANARQWSSDFGTAEVEAEYRALRAYSPYHNLRAGTCYPPTLITTGERDDRVVPWHSFKYAAALQAAQQGASTCDSPVLIRVETRAGHGAGKPTWMRIEEIADQWAFLAWALRMDPARMFAAT